MRQHIGQHMVQGHNAPHENTRGFCGTVCGANNEINTKNIFKSSCEYCYRLSAAAAIKMTERSPCTNRLISRPTCKVVVWTYNIPIHYSNRHPNISKSIYKTFEPTREELNEVYNWGTKKTKTKDPMPKNSNVKKANTAVV